MTEQTKEKIQRSFLQLLQEKHFINITVRDITTHAKINRGTFYLHYQDKYDLLTQIEDCLLKGLETHLQQLDSDSILSEAKKGRKPIHAVEMYRYIQQNVSLFTILLGDHNLTHFQKRFKQFLIHHFIEKMGKNKDIFQQMAIPKEYLSSFAVSAFLGLIQQWLDNNLSESPEEMADMFINIILFIKIL